MQISKELVQQWAREAGMQDFWNGFSSFRPCDNSIVGGEFVRPTLADLHRLVTRAMQVAFTEGKAAGRVEQAEADAALCKKESRMHLHQDRNGRSCHVDYANVAETCANLILANKPTLDN